MSMRDTLAEYTTPAGAAGDILKAAAISQAASLKVNSPVAKLKKLHRHLRTAAQNIQSQNFREAGALALKALDIDEKNPLANHIAAIAMDRMGNYELALKLYLRAVEFDPTNPEIFENLGLLAWRIAKMEQAEHFFRLQMQLEPGSINASNNLGCVLRDQGRYNEAIEILRSAIYSHPEAAILWSALGATMMEQSLTDEALQFHQEAERLAPNSSRIQHNLGYTYTVRGEPDKALEHFDRAKDINDLPADEAAVSLYARALALVALGRLEEGWDAYKVMHTPAYRKGTRYFMDIPEWTDGQSLEGRKLLLMGEQGLGDEVLFMSMANDIKQKLVGPDGRVGISCEPRLVKLFERSFPDFEIMPHATKGMHGGTLRVPKPRDGTLDYDCWMRMSTPLRLLRNNVEDFHQPETGFLKADPERVAHWRAVLDDFGPGVKAGLLWKSRIMTANRHKNFAAFDLWKPALQTPGVVWINLQYGSSAEELEIAREKFGVDIKTLPGIDLMNDLDEIAALGQALDMMVGPSNASLNLAAGAGGEIWMVAPEKGWTLLGQDKYLWYPNTRLFTSPGMGNWQIAISKLAKALADRAAERKAA